MSVVLAAAVTSALLVRLPEDPTAPDPRASGSSAPAAGPSPSTPGPVTPVVRDRHGINFWVPGEVTVGTAVTSDGGVDARVGFRWTDESQMRELGGDGHGLELRVRFTRGFAPSGRASSSLGGYTEQPGGSAGSTVVTWGVEDADVFRPGEWYEVVFHVDAGAEASSFFELTFVATSDSRQPGVPAVDRMSGDYAFTYLRDEDNTVSRVSTEGTPIPLNLLTAPDFEVAPGDPPDDYEFIYPTTRRVECSPAGSFGGTCYLRYEPLDPSGTSVLQNVPLRVKPRDVFTAEAVVRCPPGPGDCIPTLALHARPETAVDGSRESTCTIPPDGKWYAIRLDLDHNFPDDPGGGGHFEDDYTRITWELFLRGQAGRTMDVDQILLARGGAQAVDEPGNFHPPAPPGEACPPAPTR